MTVCAFQAVVGTNGKVHFFNAHLENSGQRVGRLLTQNVEAAHSVAQAHKNMNVFFENLRRKRDYFSARECAVGPHFEYKLVKVRSLSDAGIFYAVADFFDGSVFRIDGNIIDFARFVSVRVFVPSASADGYLNVEYSVFAYGANECFGV